MTPGSLGIDTDVLVSWAMQGAPNHAAARRLLETTIRSERAPIALTPQVFFEFIHVVTDSRRFARPMEMEQAISFTRGLWDAPETIRVMPGPTMLHRVLELLGSLRLGRRRILDTALAVTLSQAGVDRLATFNGRDYAVFDFLDILDPRV